MITITREQFFDFIKTHKDEEGAISKTTQHYLYYFDKHQKTGKKSGWNWAAFTISCSTLFFFPIAGLLGSYWFFYRRMQLFGILALTLKMIFFITIVLKIDSYYLESNYSYPIIIFFIGILNILISIYSDYIYLYYATKKISKGKINSGISKEAIVNWSAYIILSSLVA